jgi:hypothetical protein
MICTMGRDLFRPVVGVRPLRLAALESGGADSSSLTQLRWRFTQRLMFGSRNGISLWVNCVRHSQF